MSPPNETASPGEALPENPTAPALEDIDPQELQDWLNAALQNDGNNYTLALQAVLSAELGPYELDGLPVGGEPLLTTTQPLTPRTGDAVDEQPVLEEEAMLHRLFGDDGSNDDDDDYSAFEEPIESYADETASEAASIPGANLLVLPTPLATKPTTYRGRHGGRPLPTASDALRTNADPMAGLALPARSTLALALPSMPSTTGSGTATAIPNCYQSGMTATTTGYQPTPQTHRPPPPLPAPADLPAAELAEGSTGHWNRRMRDALHADLDREAQVLEQMERDALDRLNQLVAEEMLLRQIASSRERGPTASPSCSSSPTSPPESEAAADPNESLMADLEDHFTRAAQPVANDTHATGNADMHRAVMARLAAEVRTSSLDHEADLFSNMGGFGEPFGEDEARRALAGVIDDWGTLDDEVSKEMEDQGPSS